jgi:hypothetical protein
LQTLQNAGDLHDANLPPGFSEEFNDEDWDAYDDAPEEEINEIEELFLDESTAAKTTAELEVEIYTLRACSKSGILALQTPKFYLAGSKRAQKSTI